MDVIKKKYSRLQYWAAVVSLTILLISNLVSMRGVFIFISFCFVVINLALFRKYLNHINKPITNYYNDYSKSVYAHPSAQMSFCCVDENWYKHASAIPIHILAAANAAIILLEFIFPQQSFLQLFR